MEAQLRAGWQVYTFMAFMTSGTVQRYLAHDKE